MLPEVTMEDNPPLLRFESAVIHNKKRSIEEGRFVAQNVLKVFVRGHGDTKSEVPHLAERYDEDGNMTDQPWVLILREKLHHGQISQKYHDYCVGALEQWKKSHTVAVNGTPLESWSGLSKMEIERLKSINIFSIESLAEMTEDGMAAYGMGARNLKNRAQAYLDTPRDKEKAAEKVAALESRASEQDEQLKAMAETIKNLQAELKKKAKQEA